MAALSLGATTAPAQLPSTIDLNVTPGTESSSVTRVYGDYTNNFLGSSASNGIAFGDVDGDGFDDVILGAEGADPPGGLNAGQVVIVYGGASLSAIAEIDLHSAPGTHGETRILGDDLGDEAGFSVASGDVDGDGHDDVILGVRRADPPGGGDAGEVVVVYGSASLLPSAEIDLNSAPGTHGETRILGDDAIDWAGLSVAGGDVNGDGFDDVILGAPLADPPGGGDAGEVVIVYGRASLSASAEVDLNTVPGTHGETRVLGDDGTDFAGISVASGDVNGDGFDDVILGAIGADPPGGPRAGEVVIVYGSAALPASAEVDLDTVPGTHGETRILGDDGEAIVGGDQAGFSVAGGDVNGDGFDDVILGARDADPPGGSGAGEVVVVYGSASLPASAEIDLDSVPGTHGETRILGDDGSDRAGWSVAGGDVDGDGFDGVIFGAPFADPPGGNQAGEVVVVHGRASFPASAEIDLDRVNSGVRVLGDNAADLFGYGGEAGGDVDRDGFADFAASALRGDNPSIGGDNRSGIAYLIYGDGIAPSATVSQFTRTGDGAGGDIVPATDFGPVARCIIDFSDDDTADNGSGGASMTTVTLTRSDSSVENLASPELMADAMWTLTTDRTGHDSARVTFQYVDHEIEGLNETTLRLFHAPGPSGPWSPAFPMALNLRRNEISGSLSALSETPTHFAIAATGGSLGVDSEAIVRYLLGIDSDPTGLDVNADRGIDASDLTFNVNALSSP